MKVSRRRFVGFGLGAAAGAAAGVAAGRVFSRVFATADSTVYPPRGAESFVLSVCAMCPGGCGLSARRIGERVVKLEGNRSHPVSGGRLCPKGQAALQSLYHPDRIPGPLRRMGARGALSSFERVSWEQALAAIGSRLASLRERRRPESLVLLRGSSGGLGPRLASRFVSAFGSPNDVAFDRGDEAAALALQATQGVKVAPTYDLASADYVLSIGGALLEAWSSPVHTARAYGAFRQGRIARRGKLVQVEPRLSMTGASADEWIAVRPGTEGTFALGVAAVLLDEGLYDREFVLERTTGLEDERRPDGGVTPGLAPLLSRHFSLERVSADTGVPANVILRVAREFAAAHRGLAVGPRQGPLLPGRLSDHVAAHVLNALVGSLDAPGGVLSPEAVPLAPWPPLPDDPIAAAGRHRPRLDAAGGDDAPLVDSDPERFAEAALAGAPYAPDTLFVLGADPLFASAAPDRFAAALEKIPLVVSFATHPDDTALHADWILPEAHFLERWDLHVTPPGVPFPLASLSQPALARPLHDVRPAAEVFLDLARRTGLERALPWRDVPALLRAEMDGLYQTKRGALMGSDFDEAWVRMMEGAGWWAPGYRSADELWEKAHVTGGWWDPFYDHGDWKRVLRTKSGRAELRADLLQSLATAPRPRAPESPGALTLLLFEPLAVAGGHGAELPFLQGLLDPGQAERWETWGELHEKTAAALGIEDRDDLRLTTPQGSIVVRARVGRRVVPGVVAVPLGLGKKGGGRWASGAGSNPLRLLTLARDPLSGLPDLRVTAVQASAAGTGERTHGERRGG